MSACSGRVYNLAVVVSVKTGNLFVQSKSGDIMFPSAVQGSVSVVSGSGAVAAEKRVLGPSLDISTDTGPISVASCYSDQSKFSTQTGDLSSSSELLTRYIYF